MGLARLNGTLDTSTTPSIALALSPFPISLPFSFQLLPAGARADTGELKLGLELPLGRVLGLGGVFCLRGGRVSGALNRISYLWQAVN